jgi:hypothetical protein
VFSVRSALTNNITGFSVCGRCKGKGKMSLDPTHRSVVEELSEALPCSGQLALGMGMVGPTQCETRWRTVLASFDKQNETLIAKNPNATKEINLIRTGLMVSALEHKDQ